MSTFEVLVCDRFDAQALARLQTLTSARHSDSPGLETTELSKIDGLIIRSRTKIDSSFLARAFHLKVIVTSTSGFDHIDLLACAKANVKVMYTPNANAASACELTWGLVLAAARKLPKAHAMIHAGNWMRESLMGRQLGGATYGVIGLGRIGSRVATVADAFGMQVIAYDPYRPSDDDSHPIIKRRLERVGLDDLFRLSDVVSVHVPATPETKHMISRTQFENSAKGLIFVNTSRGTVVDEPSLIAALETGKVQACGLDVFEREPLTLSSALLGRDNVMLSPHIGATTTEAFRAASEEAVDKMIAFAQYGSTSDELPGDHPWLTRAPNRS